MTRVLILMATFNGAKWIREQLDSVLNQIGVCIYIFVSDDCSVDGTGQIIKAHPMYGEKITLVENVSVSGSAGRNFQRLFLLSKSSEFDYVALCDQDDIWKPEKLVSAINLMIRSGSTGYSSDVLAMWPDASTRLVRQSKKERSCDFLLEGAGQGCTFVIEARLFDTVVIFIRNNLELSSRFHYHDWLIYLICRINGGRWIFDHDTYIVYRQHGENEIGARNGVRSVKYRLDKIKSGWYKEQILLACQISALAGKSSAAVDKMRGFMSGDFIRFRNLKFAFYLFRHGRRRLIDRAVLFLAALRGWI
jgi:rhamnosyltransferase